MAPQTFHVVRCVNCRAFQNQIVKHCSNKWNCKLCGTKQTLIKIFGEGTAPECRLIVQKLNQTCGEYEEKEQLAKAAQFNSEVDLSSSSYPVGETTDQNSEYPNTSNLGNKSVGVLRVVPQNRSKWAIFSED